MSNINFEKIVSSLFFFVGLMFVYVGLKNRYISRNFIPVIGEVISFDSVQQIYSNGKKYLPMITYKYTVETTKGSTEERTTYENNIFGLNNQILVSKEVIDDLEKTYTVGAPIIVFYNKLNPVKSSLVRIKKKYTSTFGMVLIIIGMFGFIKNIPLPNITSAERGIRPMVF
jgi:hypothetical protein